MLISDTMSKLRLNFNLKILYFVMIGSLVVVANAEISNNTTGCDVTDCERCLNGTTKVFIKCGQTCHCAVESNLSLADCVKPEDIVHVTSIDQCVNYSINATITEGNDTTTNATTATTETTTTTVATTSAPTPMTTISTSTTKTSTPFSTTVIPASTNGTLAPTTLEPSTTATTTADTIRPVSTAASLPEARHFDGASFIGGIILALGLTAIVYVGFKFYRSRTENNYHTLQGPRVRYKKLDATS